jgi:hypothetical protein
MSAPDEGKALPVFAADCHNEMLQELYGNLDNSHE